MENIQGLKPGAYLRHNTYRIDKVLGQGGFGITYLATDLNLDRKVAIKEFFPKDYCDRESATSHVTLGTKSASEFVSKLRAKFLKEARNIAKFDNPGIIKIHAAFEENNTAYYVMDYIDGLSLQEMVRLGGPLSEKRAVRYIEMVGEALEYVHSQKINHLDIKPANIMVRGSDDNPILIDFGLSKQYDSSGHQTSTTPTGISHGYAPLEQYNEGGVKEFSPQTDLYSLAATLYFLLTGNTPPQASDIIEEGLSFPGNLSKRLVAPITKAMSASRKTRHETVRQFLKDINPGEAKPEDVTVIGVVKPQPVVTPKPQPEPEPEPYYDDEEKPKSKKKVLVAVGSAIFVLLLIFCWIGSSNDTSNDSEDIIVEEVDPVSEVADMFWESPLGAASYTGPVKSDTVSGTVKMIPHGKGTAKIVAGKYKDNVYDGEFYMGSMDGQAKYTQKNGDVFEGNFKDNHYDNGTYTVKETGESFKGSFDNNGNPTSGQWYDKNGNKID